MIVAGTPTNPAIAKLQAALAQQGVEDGIEDLGTDTLPGHALQAQQAAARRIPPKQRGLVLVVQGLQLAFEGAERALQTRQQIVPRGWLAGGQQQMMQAHHPVELLHEVSPVADGAKTLT